MTTPQLELYQFNALQPSSSNCKYCIENLKSLGWTKPLLFFFFNSKEKRKKNIFSHGHVVLPQINLYPYFFSILRDPLLHSSCRPLLSTKTLALPPNSHATVHLSHSPLCPHINPNSLLYLLNLHEHFFDSSSSVFRGNLVFGDLYFLFLLARKRTRVSKLAGIRKKYRQGRKR